MILYLFDENGDIYGINVGGTDYFFRKNLQGDVVGIWDANGNEVVTYTYDPWGKLLTVTDTTNYGLADLNPFRYRTYYYDTETGFYYLQSRYYDPETGRFINADAFVDRASSVGLNQFAYCFNNCVNMVDYDGDKPGQLFNTMDEAAIDAAKYIGPSSWENLWEYATVIYEVKQTYIRTVFVEKKHTFLWFSWTVTEQQSEMITKTQYSYTKKTTDKNVGFVHPQRVLFNKRAVAVVHTHCIGRRDNMTDFSKYDIDASNNNKLICYLYRFDGVLFKYYPSSGKTSVISKNLPISTSYPFLY